MSAAARDFSGALRPLLAVWLGLALLLAAWALVTRPGPPLTVATGSSRVTLLAAPPAEPLLAVWVRVDVPTAPAAWLVLEAGQPWPEAAERYWRRRVHPGWNLLAWEGVAALPRGRPVTLRLLDGAEATRWAVSPPVLTRWRHWLHFRAFSGLAAALALAAATAALAVTAALRRARPGRPAPWSLGVVAVSAGALALRLPTLGTHSLWFDEVLTAIGAQSMDWVLYSPQVFGHPPLQYLVGWLATLGGDGEAALRAPFVLAGTSAVPLLAVLGRRLAGPAAGLLAAGMLALSPFHVELCQLARPYALFLPLSLGSLLLLVRALEEGRARDWLGFSALGALGLYAHYLGLGVLALEGAIALAWLLRARGRGTAALLVSLAGIGVLLWPWLGVLARVTAAQVGRGDVPAARLADLLVDAIVPQFLGGGPGGLVLGALAVVGAAALRASPPVLVLAVVWVGAPVVGVWLLQPQHFVAGRHLAFVLPVLLLLVAVGIVTVARAAAGLAGRGPAALARARPTVALAVALALLAPWATTAAATIRGYYEARHGHDWFTVAEVLDRITAPGDQVLATLGAAYPLRHYWRADVTELDPAALPPPGPGRRWVVTLEGWDTAPALGAWLEAHAVRVGEVAGSWSVPRVFIHRVRGTPAPGP